MNDQYLKSAYLASEDADSISLPQDVEFDSIFQTVNVNSDSVYEIRSLATANSNEFRIALDETFGDILTNISSPEAQESMRNAIETTTLTDRIDKIKFKRDTPLVVYIRVAENDTNISLSGVKSGKYMYDTKNVDYRSETAKIISAFAKWVTYSRRLIVDELES